MKTEVEFRSSKFPAYDGEEELINPGRWGKRLAEYLVQKLSEKGVVTKPIIAEDWGWYIPIRNEGFRLAICCGHQVGDDDQFLFHLIISSNLKLKRFLNTQIHPI